MPGFFWFKFDENDMMQYEKTLLLEGNVIDVSVSNDSKSIAYSMDTTHEPFSRTLPVAVDKQHDRKQIGVLRFSEALGFWESDNGDDGAFRISAKTELVEMQSIKAKMKKKGSADFLYGLENLRKKASEG